MTMALARRPIRTAVAAALSACLLATLSWGGAPGVRAGTTITVNTVNQEINGDGFCSLQEAIYAANLDDNVAPDPGNPGQLLDTACPGGSGHDVIELPSMSVFTYSDPIDEAANFMGPTVTPMITSDITIEGRGARLQRLAAGRLARAFAVGPTGFLDLREVHVKGFSIHGGNGNDGGGGGMGAGGAIYVVSGRLLIQWSTFEGNRAEGGDGAFHDTIAGGGGGGLSGDGGAGSSQNETSGGGGGGGARGDGDGSEFGGNPDLYYAGGGGGTLTSAVGHIPGELCGGDGATSLSFPPDGAEDGEDVANTCPGGGGGGGTDREFIVDPFCGGDGGDGSYGGGGGGGGAFGDGGHGGFGGGGGGNGGHGDFGGGGGSEEGCSLSEVAGQGGTFAGDGTVSNADHGAAGGGGAGLGGAIFGHLADIDISNSTFTTNIAQWGRSGGEGANNGRGAGGAIFTVGGDLGVVNSTIAGNQAVTVTNGGGGGIVVYDPEGDDEATLVLRNTIVAGNGTAECYTQNGVTTSGSAGNLITNSGRNNLDNPPCPGVATSGDPGLGALALNAPGRTPTMSIGAASPAINAALGASPLDDQRGVSRPQGVASDIGAYEYEAPSQAAPVTTIALTPASPNGANGWYTTAVGVSIAASDFDDAVAQTRCTLDAATAPGSFADLPDAACSLTSVGADGQHTIHAASVDAAGNIETPIASASLKVDATAPSLAPSLNVSSVSVGQTGVVASANATDPTSGVASASCGTVDTSTPGPRTVTCTATDNAGNSTFANLAYVVEYRILGIFSPAPLSKWKVGQTVPVKIALADGPGVRISDADAAALARACRVTFAASGAQSKSDQCMKYDAASDQFIYNWKLGKSPTGSVTITVAVSYPGTSVTTTLSLSILITM